MPAARKRPASPPPEVNRRVAPDTPMFTRIGRRLRGLLTRPIGLQRRADGLHLVLLERRHAPQGAADTPVAQVRAELRERLLAHDLGQAAAIMRPLVKVHDALRDGGWPALAALPDALLSRAIAQTEIIAAGEPSPALSLLAERLRQARVAARLRVERQREAAAADAPAVEVSEISADEFSSLLPATPAPNESADEAAHEPQAGPVSQR